MDRKVVVVYKSDNNDMGRALTKLEKELKEFKPTYISINPVFNPVSGFPNRLERGRHRGEL